MLRTLGVTILLPAVALLGWLAMSPAESPADFVIASDELRFLDPARVSHQHETQIAYALFEGLTRIDPLSTLPKPALAESYETSADGLCWTFRLRDGLRWSDGSPLTAEDFRFAWLRAIDPRIRSQYSSLLYVIAGAQAYSESRHNADAADDLPADRVGIETPDARTIVVRLARPCAYFAELTAFPTYAPVSAAALRRESDPIGAERRWTRGDDVLCSGAFRLVRWDFKRRLLLERNGHYWDAANVPLRSIEVLIATDPGTVLLGYETGRIHLVRGVEPEAARALREQQSRGERSDFHDGDRFATFFFRVNCSREPFRGNAALRAALSLAIDKRAICERVLGLGEQPADTFVPRGLLHLMPRTDEAGRTVFYQPPDGLGAGMIYEQRVARARELLDASGYDRSRPIEILYAPDPRQQRRIVEAVEAMWTQSLGLRVRPRLLERKVLSQMVRSLEYDVATSDWYADYMDPSTFLDLFTSDSAQNRTGWSNAEYDDLIRRASRESSAAAQFGLYRLAESLLCERELPILPVYFKRGNYLLNPRFTGVTGNPLDLVLIHRVAPAPGLR